MKFFTQLGAAVAPFLIQASEAASNIERPIELSGYGKFTGTVLNTTYSGQKLPHLVDAWLGIDYATQPIGSGRFQPVDWPKPIKDIRKANTYGKSCIQQATSRIPIESQDEACLNFNVYRTRGVPLSQKLPVLVWIHGGAFYAGSWASFDGAAFAASSQVPIVVVSFHYRLNSLGFLPSKLFEDEGLLNLGIRDQHHFLHFVQKYIGSFGGDPKSVTIGGRSAGGHSVGIHYFHNYGDESRPLFARAIHQSGSVTSRAFPNASYPLYKTQYDEYLDYLGCDNESNNTATLNCLRNADADSIRNISTKIYNDYDPQLTWPFQPVHGGYLFEKPGSQSGVDGTFFHVPTISSTTTDEGKYYLPGTLENNTEFLNYLHNISPNLNSEDIGLMESLYPDPATNKSSPYTNSPNSTQYNRLAAAWSDYAYICPGQETAFRTSVAGVPTWKLRFNTNNKFPAWQGIPHTSDTQYTWDEPTAQYPEISHVYHAYLSSFVATGDPNRHRYPGSPKWPTYHGDTDKPVQLVVQPNDTKVETDNIRREACLFWRDVDRAERLNK